MHTTLFFLNSWLLLCYFRYSKHIINWVRRVRELLKLQQNKFVYEKLKVKQILDLNICK